VRDLVREREALLLERDEVRDQQPSRLGLVPGHRAGAVACGQQRGVVSVGRQQAEALQHRLVCGERAAGDAGGQRAGQRPVPAVARHCARRQRPPVRQVAGRRHRGGQPVDLGPQSFVGHGQRRGRERDQRNRRQGAGHAREFEVNTRVVQ